MTIGGRRLSHAAAQAVREIPSNAAWLLARVRQPRTPRSANGLTTTGEGPPVTADDLECLTKAELLRLAQRCDLQGRSKLSKGELISALAKQNLTVDQLIRHGVMNRTEK